jgi:hypothetical protein
MAPMMGNRLDVLKREARTLCWFNVNGPGKEDRIWGRFTGEKARKFIGSNIIATENLFMNPATAVRREWQGDF